MFDKPAHALLQGHPTVPPRQPLPASLALFPLTSCTSFSRHISLVSNSFTIPSLCFLWIASPVSRTCVLATGLHPLSRAVMKSQSRTAARTNFYRIHFPESSCFRADSRSEGRLDTHWHYVWIISTLPSLLLTTLFEKNRDKPYWHQGIPLLLCVLYPQGLLSHRGGKLDWLSNDLCMTNPWWMLLICLFASKWFWIVYLTGCVPCPDMLELWLLGVFPAGSQGTGQEKQPMGLLW